MLQRPVRIGVDVGARTLKAVLRTRPVGGGAQWHFLQCRRAQDDAASLPGDLGQLLRPLRRWRYLASLTLCAPTSYVRLLTVQVNNLKRLPEVVRGHLPKLLPFDVERAQYEFRVKRQSRVDDQWECQLSLAACEAALLQQDLAALWDAGWAARAVAPAALALAQTAKTLNVLGQDSAVLMEIGERRTTMVLVEAGEVVYARDVALGADHLIDALTARVSVGASTVSLAREEAEALMQETGIPETAGAVALGSRGIPAATYLAMLQPILEQLVSEVRRTMTFGAQAAKAAVPIRVLVSGEGSRLPNVERWLSQQLAVTVSRLNCEPLVGREGATAAIACGLALFEQAPKPNLAPRPARQRWLFLQSAARLWRGLVLATLLIWSGAGVWHLRRQGVSRELQTLANRWIAVKPVVELQAALIVHTQLVQRLVVQGGVPLEWFGRLARNFPTPVRLVRLSAQAKGDVHLEGEAQEREQTAEAYVSELGLWLERAHACRQVSLGSTGRATADDPLAKFTLTCQLMRN
ncbi:MAG: pilus assembly protein PilM [Candidatus Omnitrophica bacterium]|nr:pilus assembly protein PilM [Candidatus Omnitrophota bacterium]